MAEDPPPAAAPVTVAIVSWNTRSLLRDCLRSLESDAIGGHAEVWVVDNASHDGSADMVRDDFPWVRLIAAGENLGFGAAVNLVSGQTESPWIAPANADVRLEPGALRTLVSVGTRHPDTAVIAPRLILPDGTTQQSVYPFPTIPFTAAYVLGVTDLLLAAGRHWCIGRGFDPDEERAVPWAVGAFLLVRREAWNAVGGFDREQWMYAEDLDLGWRLKRAGWLTRYVPAARVVHNESAATKQAWGSDRYARWHASTYRWLLRRRGGIYARVIATINIVGFMMRAAALSPVAAAGAQGCVRARTDALKAARAHRVGLHSRRSLEAAG